MTTTDKTFFPLVEYYGMTKAEVANELKSKGYYYIAYSGEFKGFYAYKNYYVRAIHKTSQL